LSIVQAILIGEHVAVTDRIRNFPAINRRSRWPRLLGRAAFGWQPRDHPPRL